MQWGKFFLQLFLFLFIYFIYKFLTVFLSNKFSSSVFILKLYYLVSELKKTGYTFLSGSSWTSGLFYEITTYLETVALIIYLQKILIFQFTLTIVISRQMHDRLQVGCSNFAETSYTHTNFFEASALNMLYGGFREILKFWHFSSNFLHEFLNL